MAKSDNEFKVSDIPPGVTQEASSTINSLSVSHKPGEDASLAIRQKLARQRGDQKYFYVRNILYYVSIVMR